jgi:8-oxo-dGTP diphosphatase
MDSPRKIIIDAIRSIRPLDALEVEHQHDAIEWASSGAPLYRTQKPDIPPKHLVSYFVIFDPDTNKILLQHHLLANRWLPSGGHVDPDEDPAETVRRECLEELGLHAVFADQPEAQFITVTEVTDGDKKHTDVSLWYILQESDTAKLTIEPDRFADVKWWGIDEILGTPIDQFDPQFHRFIIKMQKDL